MIVSELFALLRLDVDDAGFKKGEAAIGGLKGVLIGVGITVGAIRAGMEALINDTASAISATNKAAQRAGVTRTAWSEMAHAAEENGIAAEGFETALKFLNHAAAESVGGSKEATAAFRKLGMSVKDGAGHAKTADVLFGEVVENWKKLPEGPEKAALAMKLFGRSGTEMIPMLNKGSKSLAEFREEAHELGLVFSDEDYEAAKKYKRSLKELHNEVEAVKLAIGKSLLKEAGGAAHAMAEWIKANRGWIVEKIHHAIDLASRAWKAAKTALDPFVTLLKWVVSQTWLWKTALAALAVALAAQFGNSVRDAWHSGVKLLGILTSITAAQVAGAAAALATGLAWAAGIAIAIMAIEELYGWITGDRETLLERWLGSFEDVKKKITGWFDTSDNALVKMARAVRDFFREAVDYAKELRGVVNGDEKTKAEASAAIESRGPAARAYARVLETPLGTMLPGGQGGGGGDSQGWGFRAFTPEAWAPLFRGSGGGPISLSIPVTVQAPPDTSDPIEYGRILGEQIDAKIDERIRGIFDPAYEAVGG